MNNKIFAKIAFVDTSYFYILLSNKKKTRKVIVNQVLRLRQTRYMHTRR